MKLYNFFVSGWSINILFRIKGQVVKVVEESIQEY